MDSQQEHPIETSSIDETEDFDRRDLVQKLGRFAAYAAPFTLLASTASAAYGTGSGKSNVSKNTKQQH